MPRCGDRGAAPEPPHFHTAARAAARAVPRARSAGPRDSPGSSRKANQLGVNSFSPALIQPGFHGLSSPAKLEAPQAHKMGGERKAGLWHTAGGENAAPSAHTARDHRGHTAAPCLLLHTTPTQGEHKKLTPQ